MSQRRHKIAVFDIDGTIFRSSLLVAFNKALTKSGVIPQAAVSELLDEYYAWAERRGSYDDYIAKVVAVHTKHIAGKERRYVAAAADLAFLAHRDRVYRYTRDLVRKLRRTHLLLAISGSPVEMVVPFGRYFGFDHMWGSVYEVDRRGRYTGRVLDARSFNRKDEIISAFTAERGLTLRGSWGVGDTESDIGFLKLVDHPICFNPNKTLYNIARRRGWAIVVERKNVVYHIAS